MSARTPSEPAAPLPIRLAFKERYLEDCRRRGGPAPVECYTRAFPDHDKAIRGEYQRLEQHRAKRVNLFTPGGEEVRRLGPYRVDAELARGGQAVVYMGYDEQLDRRIALKVLKVGPTFGRDSLLRFEREAKVLSRIEDPRVCPVYATGYEQGMAWIAMRFVDGRTVASHIADARDRNLPPSRDRTLEILEHGEAVLATLHKVHDLGILHRDLKPGNVMIDAEGPVILDFGLARDQRELDLTLSTDQLGTPAYMAPEQVRGEPADRRTDIRAFGIVLFEWLTGWHPFRAATREQMFRRILDESAEVPRSIRRSLPRPLITVLTTAIARDPDRRYQTAGDFAEDLRRVRASEPIRARPMGAWVRSLLWVSRNRVVAVMASLLFFVLISALWFSSRVIGELRNERQLTNAALRHTRALALVAEAKARGESQPQLGLVLALRAQSTEASVDTLSTVCQAYDRMRVVAEYRSDPDPTTLVTARPTRDRSCVCGYTDGAVRFFQATGRTITRHAHRAGVLGMEVTRDGARAITVDRGGRLVLWDTRSGDQISVRDMNVTPACMARAPNDERFLLGDSAGGVWILTWSLARVETRLACRLEEGVERLLISPAGSYWVALTKNNEAIAFDKANTRIHAWAIAKSGIGDFVDETRVVTQTRDQLLGEARYGIRVVDLVKRQQRDAPGFYAIHQLVSARNSRLGTIAISNLSGAAHLVNLATGGIRPLPSHPGPIYAMSFDENQHLVTACSDGKIRLVSSAGGLLQEFVGHEAACTHVEFAQSGKRLLSQGRDGLVAFWSTIGPADLDLPLGDVSITRQSENGELLVSALRTEVVGADRGGDTLFRLPTPTDRPVDILLAGDGKHLLVQHASGRTSHWRYLPEARYISTLAPSGVDTQSRFLDADGAVLSLRDSRLWYWRPEAGDLRSIGTADEPATALDASEGLGVAASGHLSGRICLWNAAGKQIARFDGHTKKVIDILLDPKRRRVISAGLDRRCNTFDFSGKRLLTCSYDAVFTLMRLSPDRELLLVGTETGETRLLRSESNRVVASFPKLNGAAVTGAIDPSGSLVAIGTSRGAVSMWRTDGTLLVRLPRNDYVSVHVEFTPDGRHLLVSGNGRRSSLYPVRTEDLLRAARGRILRDLRPSERDALAPLFEDGR